MASVLATVALHGVRMRILGADNRQLSSFRALQLRTLTWQLRLRGCLHRFVFVCLQTAMYLHLLVAIPTGTKRFLGALA